MEKIRFPSADHEADSSFYYNNRQVESAKAEAAAVAEQGGGRSDGSGRRLHL